MHQALSWKVLFLFAVFFYFISKAVDGVVGDAILVLVPFTVLMGVVDLLRALFKPKK